MFLLTWRAHAEEEGRGTKSNREKAGGWRPIVNIDKRAADLALRPPSIDLCVFLRGDVVAPIEFSGAQRGKEGEGRGITQSSPRALLGSALASPQQPKEERTIKCLTRHQDLTKSMGDILEAHYLKEQRQPTPSTARSGHDFISLLWKPSPQLV